jgi:extradiol dioxygenase family protein
MIGKLFHLAHLVNDLESTDRLYDDVFDCERYYHGYERPARREASLVVVADQCLEPIQPSSDSADAGWPLQKFKARFGNRLHSIAWYVDDIKSFTARLIDHDIRVVGLTGKPVTDPADAVAVWTHPGDTGALLEFCEAGFAADPRLADDFSAQRWRDHPLALTRTSHVTVLFGGLDEAQRVYGDALGGTLIHTDESDPSTPRAYYAIGEDTVIEAVAPTTTDTPEGSDHAEVGNGVHSITFATADLAGARAFLAEQGIDAAETAQGHVRVDLDPAHGLRMGLTDQKIPGDNRS